jgi:hypothetical protein
VRIITDYHSVIKSEIITCYVCKSVLDVEETDIFHYTNSFMGDTSQHVGFDCGACGRRNTYRGKLRALGKEKSE